MFIVNLSCTSYSYSNCCGVTSLEHAHCWLMRLNTQRCLQKASLPLSLSTSVPSLLLVAMPGAPSSFLFLVVRPGAPSSILARNIYIYIYRRSHSSWLPPWWINVIDLSLYKGNLVDKPKRDHVASLANVFQGPCQALLLLQHSPCNRTYSPSLAGSGEHVDGPTPIVACQQAALLILLTPWSKHIALLGLQSSTPMICSQVALWQRAKNSNARKQQLVSINCLQKCNDILL